MILSDKIKKIVPFSRKKAAHLRLGEKGEKLACRLLQELGIQVLGRNYRFGHGEIDIVARDGDELCFIEVKTRSNPYLYNPRDAVTPHKKRLLIKTSLHYLKLLPGNNIPKYRYDIIEVIRQGRQFRIIRYWRKAFKKKRPYPSFW